LRIRQGKGIHMNMSERLAEGLRVSALGLLGVFAVLIIFYGILVLLDKIRDKPEQSEETPN